MASLAADGCQTLDVRAGGGGGLAALSQLSQQVLDQLAEVGGATARHQVTQSEDGTLPDRHPGAGQLCVLLL